MSEETSRVGEGHPGDRTGGGSWWSIWVKGLAPLVLLGGLLLLFFQTGPLGVFQAAFPPVEELTIERVWMPETGQIKVRVVNGGPEAVTIAQVAVDEAIWTHTLDGERTVDRLESRIISIPYPWVEGEPHEVMLVTSTGLTFTGGVEVATKAPTPNARYLGTFALLGLYVGVIPVLLGILWLPFLREVKPRWVDFFLALTIGLLAFLGVDALAEALETSDAVPGAFQGLGLVLLGLVGTPLAIAAIGRLREAPEGASPLRLAFLIALGIGLHNLAEGLAIGTAYASGAIALGAFLVVGFLLHNTTEGLAIVAPMSEERPGIGRLALLGLLAGGPVILGAWIGGFSYSPLWTTLFLAVGAGAIVQVIVELVRFFRSRSAEGLTAPLNAVGVLTGLLIMYATGLLVTA